MPDADSVSELPGLKVLWAPWRLQYIEKASGSGYRNFFLELPKQDEDRKNGILYRGEHAFVILNAYPYASGHLMVAPYQETVEILDLSDEALLEIQKLVGRAINWLRAAYNPAGFNVGVNLGVAAGAGVPTHIHWHVVPRWNGDSNFMSVTAGVRVIPQSLEETYDRLKGILDAEL
jgi:ATP adenylyltransferase